MSLKHDQLIVDYLSMESRIQLMLEVSFFPNQLKISQQLQYPRGMIDKFQVGSNFVVRVLIGDNSLVKYFLS